MELCANVVSIDFLDFDLPDHILCQFEYCSQIRRKQHTQADFTALFPRKPIGFCYPSDCLDQFLSPRSESFGIRFITPSFRKFVLSLGLCEPGLVK